MAIRKIVKMGDDTLRKRCHPVSAFDRKLASLLKDMAETMYAADGVGLAAPQVGILRRIVVIDVGDGLVELVNPVILESRGSEVAAEGCLSVPGRRGKPMEFEAEGLFARCICHELDHLDGVLYCDKMIEDVTDQTEKA